MIVFVKCRRSESKCFKRSYVFADCNGCVLLRTQGNRKAILYVFADCNDCVC